MRMKYFVCPECKQIEVLPHRIYRVSHMHTFREVSLYAAKDRKDSRKAREEFRALGQVKGAGAIRTRLTPDDEEKLT
jgi:hypothetical protein